MTTPEKSPAAGLNRRSMIGAGLGVLGGAAALSALSAGTARADAVDALFTGITPVRVVDSRYGTGGETTKIVSGQVKQVDLGDLDLPIVSLVTAVVNVTVTNTEGAAWLRLWDGGTQPFTSNINWWGPGQVYGNLAIVPLSASNQMSVRCGGTGGKTHWVIDLLGYFVGIGIPIKKGS